MGTITINVDDHLESQFRKKAGDIYNVKKGYLGKAVTDALKDWIEGVEQKEIARKELKRLEKGYYFGKKLYTKREDLYG